jgi:uracil-DNA glycosylase
MSLKRKASELPSSDPKKPKANASITSFFGAPKVVSPATKATGSTTASVSSSPASVSKFDKETWVKKLTDEQRELLKLEIETLHESWLKELKDEVVSKEFLELKRFLKKEVESGKKVFPPMEDVYSWFVFFRPPLSQPFLPPITLLSTAILTH